MIPQIIAQYLPLAAKQEEICKLITDAAEYYNSVKINLDPKTWEAQFKKATKNTHEKNNKRPRKK